jgi:hypothetical protein
MAGPPPLAQTEGRRPGSDTVLTVTVTLDPSAQALARHCSYGHCGSWLGGVLVEGLHRQGSDTVLAVTVTLRQAAQPATALEVTVTLDQAILHLGVPFSSATLRNHCPA